MLKEYRVKVARRMLNEVNVSGVHCGMFYFPERRIGKVVKCGPQLDKMLRDYPKEFLGVYSIRASLHDVLEDMQYVVENY